RRGARPLAPHRERLRCFPPQAKHALSSWSGTSRYHLPHARRRLDSQTLPLSLSDTTEKLQWGENLCFKVRGKIFAIVDLSEGSLAPITLKCAPEQFHDLLEIEGIAPAPYVGRYKWILLENSNVLPSDKLEALNRQSSGLVRAKAPKKKSASGKPPSSHRKR